MVIENGLSLDQVWELSWQEIRRAVVDKKHEFRYFTLATLCNQSPYQRTVVLRAVESFDLFVYTDSRSDKVTQIKENPSASLLFYSKKQKFQCRINAHSSVHSKDQLSARHEQQVDGDARLSYSSQIEPGVEIDAPETAYRWDEKLNFCVLKFVPYEVEVLQLINHKHIRARFLISENEWKGKWLQP